MTALALLVIDRHMLGRDGFGSDGLDRDGLGPATGLAATGSAAADAVGGPSMQISMQFLLQLVKDFLRTVVGWEYDRTQQSTIWDRRCEIICFAILITICNLRTIPFSICFQGKHSGCQCISAQTAFITCRHELTERGHS